MYIQLLKLLKQRISQALSLFVRPLTIALNSIQEIPEGEKWLFEPENKSLLEKLKRGLEDSETTHLGSFRKYLEKKHEN